MLTLTYLLINYLFDLIFIFIGVTPFLLQLWKDSRLKGPVVQARASFFSIGCMFAPIIFFGLLVDLKVPVSCNTLDTVNDSSTDVTIAFNQMVNISHTTRDHREILIDNSTTGCFAMNPKIKMAQWSFAVNGAMILIPFVFFLYSFLSSHTTRLQKVNASNANINQSETSGLSDKFLLKLFVVSVMVLIFLNGVAMGTLLQYLQTFATLFLGWEVKTAALLNFVVGCMFAMECQLLSVVLLQCLFQPFSKRNT